MPRLLFIIGLIALLGFLFIKFPYAAGNPDDKFQIVYLVMLLALVAGGGIAVTRENLPRVVRDIAIWVVIFAVLLLGYSYRDVLMDNRLVAELMPYRVRVSESGALVVRGGDNGHFFIEASVNDIPVKFMVDTGASDVVLRPQDAARLGINMPELTFNRPYQTANGIGRGAAVNLRSIEVGPMLIENMPASINEAPMDHSLLGMTFLSRFRSFQVTGNTLTLQP